MDRPYKNLSDIELLALAKRLEASSKRLVAMVERRQRTGNLLQAELHARYPDLIEAPGGYPRA
jgi:hypothetical protein